MKVVRSWPEVIPPGRCYVVDTLPRFVMSNHDYRGLGALDDDVLMIEWDIAVSREDLARFRELIAERPGEVLVAPYRLYTATETREKFPSPPWVMRRYQPGDQTMRWVDEGDETCHLWGLGLTYLPRDVIAGYLKAFPEKHFSDTGLSAWHCKHVRRETRIAWDVRPVHLHYLIDEENP